MEIFLGYPSEYRSVADEVYGFLTSLGHAVWQDTNALVGGVEWRREREIGQRNAQMIIHLCAEEMMSRAGDVNREIKLTLDLIEDQPLGALFAVFVRVNEFRLPVELTRFQYIDKFRDDWKFRLEAAVQKRQQQLARPSAKPTKGEVTREAPAIHGQAELIEVLDSDPPNEASAKYLRYDRSAIYWQWINGEIAAKALRGYFGAKKHFADTKSDDDSEPSDDHSYFWGVTTEEFFLQGQMLSLRFYTYYYFGGAHPNHYVETLNFLGPGQGALGIRELLDNDNKRARRLIDYCERVVSASFDEEESPMEFHLLDKNDEEQVWSALEEFNFDSKGMTFNFSPYVVMGYAFGTQTVIVPWVTMHGFLGDDWQLLSNQFTSTN